ncbi:MAG TPA: ClpX C4-type zinc finger protein [Kofleriaceae bacterium]|nr:ClpX C4-type zinc finger protein [Kofleriaceae bacterium]
MKPDAARCPLCSEAIHAPMSLDVCGDCFQDLRASGHIALQTTGEFSAVSPEMAERPRPAPRPRSFTGDRSITCTWCGKSREQVKKILSSEAAHLCNECVALCADILEAEVGPGWRG